MHLVGEGAEGEAEEVGEVWHALAGVQVVEHRLDHAVVLALAAAGDAALRIVRQEVPPRALRWRKPIGVCSTH